MLRAVVKESAYFTIGYLVKLKEVVIIMNLFKRLRLTYNIKRMKEFNLRELEYLALDEEVSLFAIISMYCKLHR